MLWMKDFEIVPVSYDLSGYLDSFSSSPSTNRTPVSTLTSNCEPLSRRLGHFDDSDDNCTTGAL